MTHKQKKNIGYFEFWDRANLTWSPDQEKLALSSIASLRRLAPALHRQCENACNGEGYIPRKGFFRCDSKEAYISDDVSVFDAEIDRLTKEINIKLGCIPDVDGVEIQHDPRGWEIKFNIKGIGANHLIYN
jgi:hypothetical protein